MWILLSVRLLIKDEDRSTGYTGVLCPCCINVPVLYNAVHHYRAVAHNFGVLV